LLGLPTLSYAQWGWGQYGGTPGSVRQADGALWEDMLERFGEKPCAEKSEARCVPYYLAVRNDSELPIQCSVRLGTTRWGDIVVDSKDANRAGEFLVPVGEPVPAFSSKCVLLPATLPPRPADACETETTVVYPELYYPDGARRRVEGGETVIDVKLSDTNRILAFRVVRSSGWQSIDTAAMKVVKAMRYAPGCGGKTVRRGVLFEVWKAKEMKQPENCHGGCTYTPTNDIAVSVTSGG
jgi:TonB family protein